MNGDDGLEAASLVGAEDYLLVVPSLDFFQDVHGVEVGECAQPDLQGNTNVDKFPNEGKKLREVTEDNRRKTRRM